MNVKNKELQIIIDKEDKFINKKNKLFSDNMKSASKIIEQKIPEKMYITTEATFESTFDFIFDEGDKILEKTYSKEKIITRYEKNKNKFNNSKKYKLEIFDKSVKVSNTLNTLISGIKSTAFGILGIGLADIPIFICEIIRIIYQNALKYGYRYDTEFEKIYILSIIGFSMGDKQEKIYYSDICDTIAQCIHNNIEYSDISLADMKSNISSLLVKKVCGIKFVQGVFIIGVFSSISNMSIINDVSNASYIKYKKRFLNYKLCKKASF